MSFWPAKYLVERAKTLLTFEPSEV